MQRTICVIDGAKMSAVSYYRVHQPFAHIMRHDPDIEVVPIFKPPDSKELMYFDAVVIKRPQSETEVMIIQTAKSLGCKVILDFDDNLYDIMPWNPAFAAIKSKLPIVSKCVEMADLIIFSTEECRDHFGKHTKTSSDVIVAKNALNNPLDRSLSEHKDKEVFVWRGGGSHSRDIEHGRPFLTEVMKDPESRMEYWGHCPPFISGDSVFRSWYSSLNKYLNELHELSPNTVVCPLNDDPFNYGKSNILFLEATSAGANVIGSHVNREFRVDGIVKLEKDRAAQALQYKKWKRTSRQRREELYEIAKKTVNSEYVLSIQNDKRVTAIKKLWT